MRFLNPQPYKIFLKHHLRLDFDIFLQGLHTGDRFVVLAEEGVVILKTIFPPEQSEYYDLVKKTRRAVKTAGVTKASVSAAIKKVRKK
ncbi:MAG: hypothetical protein E6K54_07785 [Gammaproteobacteria bacterium]|nr:MAG: hypothetical protein E6K54_07785 [Gammaproteobacteria bacterium]